MHARSSHGGADRRLYGKGIPGRSSACDRRKHLRTTGKTDYKGFVRDNAVDDELRRPVSALVGGNASPRPHERVLPRRRQGVNECLLRGGTETGHWRSLQRRGRGIVHLRGPVQKREGASQRRARGIPREKRCRGFRWFRSESGMARKSVG